MEERVIEFKLKKIDLNEYNFGNISFFLLTLIGKSAGTCNSSHVYAAALYAKSCFLQGQRLVLQRFMVEWLRISRLQCRPIPGGG